MNQCEFTWVCPEKDHGVHQCANTDVPHRIHSPRDLSQKCGSVEYPRELAADE